MRYLIRYNESLTGLEFTKLETLCDDKLAYLMDAGFVYRLYNNDSGIIILILHETKNYFKWEDIKEDILPFIELLEDKYFISDIYMVKKNSYNQSLLKRGFVGDSSVLISEYEIDRIVKNFTVTKLLKEFTIEIKNIK